MSDRHEIEYSEKIPGSVGNYRWAITMDDNDGFLGVTQASDGVGGPQRVLLSPKQVAALFAFYRKWHPRKRAIHG